MSASSRSSSALKAAFRKTPLCLAISTLLTPVYSLSAPVVGSGGVVSGAATIVQSGKVTDVNQTSNKAAINWWSFSTKPGETVNFNQPNSSSITLNRVIGNEKSVLQGALNANGKVFLINSNGVLITKGASVNAASFVASTLDISNDDFNKDKYRFKAKANALAGSVVNQGTITVKPGGYVALLGNQVSNQGVITATKGTVSLNSGNKITLNFNGDSLVNVTIDEGTLNGLVENGKAIYADGGHVIMTAKAADALLGSQVNNTGLVQAQTIDDLKGSIEIYAHGGTANIAGTLDASAQTSGDGGFIETSGDKVKIADSTVITTKSAQGKFGTWLIDPTDFTVTSGSAGKTDSGVGASTLSGMLNSTNVSIETANAGSGAGDINVNADVSWNANTTLSLDADRDINVNAGITATGASAGLVLDADRNININAPIVMSGREASLAMIYGDDYNIRTKASYAGTVLDASGKPIAKKDTSGGVYGNITLSGDNATLHINGDNYKLIHSIADLEAMAPVVRDANGQPILLGFDANFNPIWERSTASGKYAIVQDLDAGGKTYSSSIIDVLDGTLTGLGHTISNLTIKTPDLSFYGSDIYSASSEKVGLISQTGSTNPVTIRDIGLTNVNISGGASVSALLGYSDSPNLTVKNSYSTGNITTYDGYSGGLIGRAMGARSTITNVFSSVNLTGGGTAGGLIGTTNNATITNAYAMGNVTAEYDSIGGLVGEMAGSNVANSYATGTVTSPGAAVGGLIGTISPLDNSPSSSVTYSFASGKVTGSNNVGGLIGAAGNRSLVNTVSTKISHSYATGDVEAKGVSTRESNSALVGGLLGQGLYVDIDNSFASGAVRSTTTAPLAFYIGGLVGRMIQGSIVNSHAYGDVYGSTSPNTSSQFIGGLVGAMNGTPTNVSGGGPITNSSASGDVIGGVNSVNVGGLAGVNSGAITGSSASGNVSGKDSVGGLVGHNSVSGGKIDNSSFTGSVSGVINVGGLAGYNGGSLTNSWVTGAVSGTTNVGAIAGSAGPTSVTANNFFNSDTTGQSQGIGTVQTSSSGATPIIGKNQGLTNEEWPDLDSYMDGSIGALLIQRALSAEAIHRASEIISAAQRHGTDVNPVLTTFNNRPSSIDNQITFVDTKDYSADIKSITVDGVRFELDDEDKKKN